MTEKKHINITEKFLRDPVARSKLIFGISVFVTAAFAVFNAVVGWIYKSLWHGSLALYYIMLVLQKLILTVVGQRIARKYRENKNGAAKAKTKLYFFSGLYLLLLDLALAVPVIQMATIENPADTGTITAIATATYTFYYIISATVNMVKARKKNDLRLQIIHNITFVTAVVSMLALTSTMICTFGEFESMRIMLVCVASGVWLTAVSTGVIMTVNGAVRLAETSCANRGNRR